MVWFSLVRTVGVVWVFGAVEMAGVVRVAEVVVVMKPVFFNIHGYAGIGCLGPLVLFRLIYK